MSLTSVIRYARALDSAATDGSGKTALAFGDIIAKYLVQGGTLTSLTTEAITTLGTYQAPTSAAHIRITELAGSDPTKGVYEIHFHNTQVAETGTRLWLFLSASGAAIQPLELNLLTAGGAATTLLDLTDGVETSITVRKALRAIAAVLGGDASGAGTGAEAYKAIGNAGTTRVTPNADSSGNRTSVTLNL